MPVRASYNVRVLPELHELAVVLRLEGLAADVLRLATPTWVPGAYGFMKFARDVFEVRACDARSGAPVSIVREGWSGFRVETPPPSVDVSFRVYAFEPAWGELAGFVAHDQALLLAARLLHVPGLETPCRVRYALPPGWALHHPGGAEKVGDGVFEYPSFAALLDAPVVAGAFERRTRSDDGAQFHFVFLDLTVGFEEEVDGFIDALMRVAATCREVFGRYPFGDYTFIFTFDPRASWGLEHANATTIGLAPDTLIDGAERARGLRVSAHELFHAWIGCRLRPAPLGKPDLVAGSFPAALWLTEGFTRYYEFLLCVRAGVISPEDFFSNVVNYQRQLTSQPAYARVAPADSSLATFLNHGRYPGSVNSTIDYYDAGMLIAFDLDVALRCGPSERGLDSVVRGMFEHIPGADVSGVFATLDPALGELVVREAGEPAALITERSLERLGFEVRAECRPTLGLVLADGGGPVVANVLDDSPAGRSGLAPGDEIVRVDGFPFSAKALEWLIERRAEVALEVRRGHRTHRFSARPQSRSRIGGIAWRGDEEQVDRIRDWLGRRDFAPPFGEPMPLGSFENFHGVQAVI